MKAKVSCNVSVEVPSILDPGSGKNVRVKGRNDGHSFAVYTRKGKEAAIASQKQLVVDMQHKVDIFMEKLRNNSVEELKQLEKIETYEDLVDAGVVLKSSPDSSNNE